LHKPHNYADRLDAVHRNIFFEAHERVRVLMTRGRDGEYLSTANFFSRIDFGYVTFEEDGTDGQHVIVLNEFEIFNDANLCLCPRGETSEESKQECLTQRDAIVSFAAEYIKEMIALACGDRYV
jgi:hypothetical protein